MKWFIILVLLLIGAFAIVAAIESNSPGAAGEIGYRMWLTVRWFTDGIAGLFGGPR